MKEIRIKNELKTACEIVENLLLKLNDIDELQLDSFNKFQMLENKEIIRFSNKHEKLSDKLFSIILTEEKDETLTVEFKDYLNDTNYEFEVVKKEDYCRLFETAREFAVDKHIRILDNSARSIIDKINNK